MRIRDNKPRLRAGALAAALTASLLVMGTPFVAHAEEADVNTEPTSEAVEAPEVHLEVAAEESSAALQTDQSSEAPSLAAPVAAPSGFSVSGTVATDPAVTQSVVNISPIDGEDRRYECDSYDYPNASGNYTVAVPSKTISADIRCEDTPYIASYNLSSSATASAPFGYTSAYWAGEDQPSSPWREDAKPLSAANGAALTGINFGLIKNGSASGTVSAPGEGVVALKPGIGYENGLRPSQGGRVMPDGSYSIQVPSGEYQFALVSLELDPVSNFLETVVLGYFGANGIVTDVAAATTVSVSGGVVTPNINFFEAGPPAPNEVVAGSASISGVAEVGKTLTATVAGWQPSDVSLTYQWLRNGVAVAGAISATYVLTGDDANAVMSVTVTGAKQDFTSATKTSSSIGPVVDLTPGSMTVSVQNASAQALAGAWVSVSSVATGARYFVGAANSAGQVELADMPRADYLVESWGQAGGSAKATVSIATPGQHVTPVLIVQVPKLPVSVEIDGSQPGSDAVSISPGISHPISVTATPGGSGTFTVMPGNIVLQLKESPGAPGQYEGVIPAHVTTPNADGKIEITVNLSWADSTPDFTESFELIYIDPSGHIVDRFGTPLGGSTVTLFRSATQDGTFDQVADGDNTVMDPSVNDENPFTTNGEGFFRWDVAFGWYKVQADYNGASITTAAMPVPPEQLNLLIAVPTGTAPKATVAPSVSGDAKVGSKLTVSAGKWPVTAGELAPIEALAYQWFRGGQPILGATQSQYTVTEADQGKTLTVALQVGRALEVTTGQIEAWSVATEGGKVASGNTLANTGSEGFTAEFGMVGAALLLLIGAGVVGIGAVRRKSKVEQGA